MTGLRLWKWDCVSVYIDSKSLTCLPDEPPVEAEAIPVKGEPMPPEKAVG